MSEEFPLRTREDAIAYFKSRGYTAYPRDWAAGKSIFVGTGKSIPVDDPDLKEITLSDLFLHRCNAGWAVVQGMRPGVEFSRLREAVVYALERLEAGEMPAPHVPGPFRSSSALEAAMNQNADRSLLRPRLQDSPEAVAAGLLWALRDMLPWHVMHPKAGMHLIRTGEQLQRLWTSQGGEEGKLPVVDFSRSMVAAIFLDEGSYNRAPGIREVRIVGDRIQIRYAFSERPWKMMNPCSVIRMDRADGEADFVEIPG